MGYQAATGFCMFMNYQHGNMERWRLLSLTRHNNPHGPVPAHKVKGPRDATESQESTTAKMPGGQVLQSRLDHMEELAFPPWLEGKVHHENCQEDVRPETSALQSPAVVVPHTL